MHPECSAARQPLNPLPPPIESGTPLSALAPMQDVTTRNFMHIVAGYGPPDYFFTEYFRVHSHSTPEPHILESIVNNTTGRPVFAQLIGEDTVHIVRTIRLLRDYPCAGIDLNMGCPAPKVYRKNVGGGLLRDPICIDRLLGVMRDAIDGIFSVKMRFGFEDDRHFETILALLDKHRVDLVSLHARTVRQMYRGEPDYSTIHTATKALQCPIIANGNLVTATKAHHIIGDTGCNGAMFGRSAIRNPWIFTQFRQQAMGLPMTQPTLGDVRGYIDKLWQATAAPGLSDRLHTARMKKFLNFIGEAVDPDGQFLHSMRRAADANALFAVCDAFLIEQDRDTTPFPLQPFQGLTARPNHE